MGRLDDVLHLHRLDRRERSPRFDLLTLLDKHLHNSAWHRRLSAVSNSNLSIGFFLEDGLLDFDLERGTLIVELCNNVVLSGIYEKVNVVEMVVRPDDQVVGLRLRHVALRIQNHRRELAIFIFGVDVKRILINVLHEHRALIRIVTFDQDQLPHRHIVHAEVITAGPRVNITLAAGAILQILEENLGDGHCAASVQRKLAIRLKQLSLILLNEAGVKDTPFELVVLKYTREELNIGG